MSQDILQTIVDTASPSLPVSDTIDLISVQLRYASALAVTPGVTIDEIRAAYGLAEIGGDKGSFRLNMPNLERDYEGNIIDPITGKTLVPQAD